MLRVCQPLILSGFLLLGALTAQAQHWPSFRGPRASGVAENADPPATWNLEKGVNVVWRTPIRGLAHSSPVIWGNRFFLTTAVSNMGDSVFQFPLEGKLDLRTDTSRHQFRVLSLDKKSGRVIWDRLALESFPRVARHPHNSYAAATPATDGRHLVAFFGSEGLYAFDLGGKLLWKQDLGALPLLTAVRLFSYLLHWTDSVMRSHVQGKERRQVQFGLRFEF